MKMFQKKSKKLLMLILACVMVLSVATAAVTVYNNNSKADVLQENVVDNDVENEEAEDSEEEQQTEDNENQLENESRVENENQSEDESQTENYIDPKEVRFMQSSIKNQTGEYTVLDNAKSLKEGTLKPEDMPLIRLWKDDDGKIWTLDHRRLAAFRLAGLESVPFVWASEEEVASQMWKMTTTTDGKTIRLKLGNGKNQTVR